ncbi:MAG: hypothetical protein ACHRHE_16740 [Tepidisphaerales bacterium]
MKILIGNILFAATVGIWYVRYGSNRPVFLSGAVLALLAYVMGTCMGWWLKGMPRVLGRPGMSPGARRPPVSAVGRMCRFTVNALTALSGALCVVVLALWGVTLRDYNWAIRSAPQDGRLIMLRNIPEIPSKLRVQSIAPWPHPAIRDWYYEVDGALPAERAEVQINPVPELADSSFSWEHLGIAFHRQQSVIAMQIPAAPPATGDSRPRVLASGQPVWNWSLHVPYWLAGVLFALPVLLVVLRRLLTRRSAVPGICSMCGYDFRTGKDRCPGCGATLRPAPDA